MGHLKPHIIVLDKMINNPFGFILSFESLHAISPPIGVALQGDGLAFVVFHQHIGPRTHYFFIHSFAGVPVNVFRNDRRITAVDDDGEIIEVFLFNIKADRVFIKHGHRTYVFIVRPAVNGHVPVVKNHVKRKFHILRRHRSAVVPFGPFT